MEAEDSLLEFSRQAWPILEPGTEFVGGRHIEAICDHLQAVSDGHIRNLLINMPPRHGKSLLVSVFWPVWSWIRKPQGRWLFASYALSLSVRDSLKCRRLIESPWFQGRWASRFQLTSDQNAKMRFENDRTGYRIATSVGGAATGEGGDAIVVDDPHNAMEAESETVRESALTWWDETMSTRLNDPKTGAKVIVMQRLHEKDLSGHVLKQGGYEHLCLPAEFEPDRRYQTSVGTDWRTERGQLLWPARVGAAEIADFKIRLGPRGYPGQFQQTPTAAEGGRFKQNYFRYFWDDGANYRLVSGSSEKAIGKDTCWRFSAMDPAGIDKEQNSKACYTVIQVWAVSPSADMILLDQYRQQVETPDAVSAAAEISRAHRVAFLAVEKNGLGLGIVQTLQRMGITILPIEASASKEARSEIAEIRMAAGMVYFPRESPWRFDLEKELLTFPNSEYKDQVDTMSHAAQMVQERHGPPKAEVSAEPIDFGDAFRSDF